MEIRIGTEFINKRKITDDLIRAFAEVSGDHNPIHLDEKFARSTRFGGRIAHGMLSGALISAVLGNQLKDLNIVYLSQTMRFLAPVFIDDEITVTGTVTKIKEEKGLVTLSTVCTNQDGKVTLEGEAVVMVMRRGE